MYTANGSTATATARQYRNMRDTAAALLVSYDLAFAVLVAAAEQHDKIDQRPYSAAAQRDELHDTDGYLARIKTVDAERAKEETQQQRSEPILTALVRIGSRLLQRTAAIGARLCRIRHLLSAIPAINQAHNF